MIYSLRGALVAKESGFAVVECMGVGYKCSVSMNTLSMLPKEGEEVFLYTFMVLRQDACELFGFYSKSELDCFKMLTTVSGVGAKMGLAVLSTMSPDSVASAVASGDLKALTQCPGVGKKLASRILLELKDKMSFDCKDLSNSEMTFDSGNRNTMSNETAAREALISLGYSGAVASNAIAKCGKDMSVEEMIKFALKQMMK